MLSFQRSEDCRQEQRALAKALGKEHGERCHVPRDEAAVVGEGRRGGWRKSCSRPGLLGLVSHIRTWAFSQTDSKKLPFEDLSTGDVVC